MILSDEKLMSYADGQLDESERAQVGKLVAQDPALDARLEIFRATGHNLASVFDEQMNAPLPEKLRRFAERPQPRVAQKSGLSEFMEALRNFLQPVHPFGLAAASVAALALGIGVSSLVIHGSGDGDGSPLDRLIQADNGGSVARGPLNYALNSLQSGKETSVALANGQVVRMGVKLSFRGPGQDYCRQYEIGLAASGNYGGIACQSNGQWNIRFQAALAPTQQSPDKGAPAAGKSQAMETAVISMIVGDAMGPAEEDAMILKGWKKR
jgi:hypothetical protein